MTRRTRLAWAAALMLAVLLAGTRRPAQAFLGLDPASWIVVGQMASVVSQMVAVRDSMMRLRDEALSHARGLIQPVDDFAGEVRSALRGGDWSAFNAGDVPHPEDTGIGACPGGTFPDRPPPRREGRRGRRWQRWAAERVCVPDDLPELTADMAGDDAVPAEAAEAFRLRQAMVEAEHDRMRSESEYAKQVIEGAAVKIANWQGCETDPGRGSSAMRCPDGVAETEGGRAQLLDALDALSSADCEADGGDGSGGACPSMAQLRSLMVTGLQSMASFAAAEAEIEAAELDIARRDEEARLLRAALRRQEAIESLEGIEALFDADVSSPAFDGGPLAGW